MACARIAPFHHQIVPLSVAMAVLLVGGAAATSASAGPLFPNPVYTVGGNPYGLARGDFNGDGIGDLAAGNFQGYFSPGEVSVLLGRPDGTFEDERRLIIDRIVSDLLAADVNGDGRTDLLVVSWNETVVMLSRGDGTFGAPYSVAAGTSRVQIANFNDDGRPDLFVLGWNGFSSYLEPLLGQSDGTFFVAGAVLPGDIESAVAADVNGDGRDDMLAATRNAQREANDILVFLQGVDGSFTEASRFSTGRYARHLIALDADGDGAVDLAITADYDSPIGVNGAFLLYFGNGDGTFDAGTTDLNAFAQRAVAADFDRDGLGDYAVTDGYTVSVRLGRGNRQHKPSRPFYAARSILDMLETDFDRDGAVDLVFLSNFGGAIFTYRGNGDGTFGPRADGSVASALQGGIAAADFNEDGRLDVASVEWNEGEVAIMLGRGDGTFAGGERYLPDPDTVLATAADFDGDGHVDLAVVSDNWGDDPLPPGTLYVMRGRGDGRFAHPDAYEVGTWPVALEAADLDDDGILDLLVAYCGVSWIAGNPGGLSLLPGRGDGTFDAAMRIDVGVTFVPSYGADCPTGMATGDFDRDGYSDIAVAMSGVPGGGVEGDLRVLSGLGGGVFAAPRSVVQAVVGAAVAAGDLNGDGLLDLVFADGGWWAGSNPGGVRALIGRGDGTFIASALLGAGRFPRTILLEDFTGDHVVDMAVVNDAGYLAILPGHGNGSFGARLNFGLFGDAAVAPGDFDDDGLNELAVVAWHGLFIMDDGLPPFSVDAVLSFGSAFGRGSATLTWTTSAERDLVGFNVLVINNQGTQRLNPTLIPCEECVTGIGHTYTLFLPRHRGGRNVYLETVHTDGRVRLFGPARRE